jgi:hypothetical protein
MFFEGYSCQMSWDVELYAFDPRRSAILLIGADKTGDDRWYDMTIPIADRLYDEHLEQLRQEGLIDG